jgi:hypothetical protein
MWRVRVRVYISYSNEIRGFDCMTESLFLTAEGAAYHLGTAHQSEDRVIPTVGGNNADLVSFDPVGH